MLSFDIKMVKKKPDHIEFPKTWSRFQRTDSNGNVRKFKIQDCTEDRFDEVVDMMTYDFLPDEPICTGFISEDTSVVKNLRTFWKEVILASKMSIICVEEVQGEPLVGCNLLVYANKEDHNPDMLKELISEKAGTVIGYIMKKFNAFEIFGVDEYLSACGLCVGRNYRGMNIASEILNAREKICKELNFKVTETLFSTIGSQKAAIKSGFSLLMEIPFEEISENTHIKINSSIPTAKAMFKKYD